MLINLHITKRFLAYCSSGLGIRILNGLFVPFWISFISISDYGLWILINSLITLCYLISGSFLKNYLTIQYVQQDKEIKKKFLNKLLNIYICFSLPFLFFIILLLKILNNILNFNLLSSQILLIFFCSISYFINEFYCQILRLELKTPKVIKLQFLSTLFSITSIFIFVVLFKMSINGLILSYLISLSIITISSFHYFKNNLINHYEKPSKELFLPLKESVLFLPSNLCGWFTSYSPRWFLAMYWGLSEVGIYSIADLFVQAYELAISQPIQYAYLPYLFNQYHQNTKNIIYIESKNIKNTQYAMFFLLILIFFALFFLQIIFKNYLNLFFYQSILYGLLLSIGSVFLMAIYTTGALIQYKRQNKFLANISIAYIILSNLLYTILIPHYKIYGAIFGFIFSAAITYVLYLYYNYILLKRITSNKN